jgi:DNA-directed RNA polymerase specialized sigma24 family protein
MSLVEDDARRDNLDAIELYHDVLTRVWERLRSGESVTENIGDVQGYAAAITHNVWSDYLRQRYPKRASLKNRLRYFLTHQSKYGVWESSDGEMVWDLLELDDDDLAELGGLSAPEEKFCLLWKHLPLADTTIARLLELERQQVINRRMLAMRELARALGDAGQEPFSSTR